MAAADVATADIAALLVALTIETAALIRTASGATFTVPSAEMVMYLFGVDAVLAGASTTPPTRATARENIEIRLNTFVFIPQLLR
jgi:hypothetical protein